MPSQARDKKCINFAYLCGDKSGTEFKTVERDYVKNEPFDNESKVDSVLNPRKLICYKRLLQDMYDGFNDIPYPEIKKQITKAVCPRKAWRPYVPGISPTVTYEREQQAITQRWVIAGDLTPIYRPL